ncbi:hypothetical protein [Bacillus chungangensis]|uniref:TusA-related sulfurtransferase n=1 Tax=Bacillus chungangensis TaxID=587633 RepID=A0ABT9WMN5_9BACI|nr:hypothetical protein [Bacillus chungangensis]MDQ0174553.1 TusA-related sulfurtransferase [Bacillus chungangensis]
MGKKTDKEIITDDPEGINDIHQMITEAYESGQIDENKPLTREKQEES